MKTQAALAALAMLALAAPALAQDNKMATDHMAMEGNKMAPMKPKADHKKMDAMGNKMDSMSGNKMMSGDKMAGDKMASDKPK